MILLPQPPKCRKYRNVQPLLSLFSYFSSHLIRSFLLPIMCPSMFMMCMCVCACVSMYMHVCMCDSQMIMPFTALLRKLKQRGTFRPLEAPTYLYYSNERSCLLSCVKGRAAALHQICLFLCSVAGFSFFSSVLSYMKSTGVACLSVSMLLFIYLIFNISLDPTFSSNCSVVLLPFTAKLFFKKIL